MKEFNRGEFLKLAGLGLIAFAIARCNRVKVSPTPPSEIPAHERALLPEAIARATEEARRPTPTFEKRLREPQVSDIQIERELFSRCAPYKRDPMGDDLWGGWIVRLNNPAYYLKNGKFELELLTPSGGFIVKEPLVNVKLASNTLDYIPAFIDPGPKLRAMGTGPIYFISGEGSRLGSVKLKATGPMEWARVDGSIKEYKWEADFRGPTYCKEQFYPYPQGRMRRSFWVELRNTGERVIKDIGIFGVMSSPEGSLIDILMGHESQISYGGSKVIEVCSLSETGRCAHLAASNSELLYWIHFETYTGMPIVTHAIEKVSSW